MSEFTRLYPSALLYYVSVFEIFKVQNVANSFCLPCFSATVIDITHARANLLKK